jgi:hypothetical protein
MGGFQDTGLAGYLLIFGPSKEMPWSFWPSPGLGDFPHDVLVRMLVAFWSSQWTAGAEAALVSTVIGGRVCGDGQRVTGVGLRLKAGVREAPGQLCLTVHPVDGPGAPPGL